MKITYQEAVWAIQTRSVEIGIPVIVREGQIAEWYDIDRRRLNSIVREIDSGRELSEAILRTH